MVVGLDIFAEHFKGYENHYALIGGVACDLAMDALGETFRRTKDIDIVLCLESLTPAFVRHFWDFIKAGGYDTRQKSTGRKLFYRFHSPANKGYPFMLELFSRIPDALDYKGQRSLTPIPAEDEASSLSAILLDDEYYSFIQAGKIEMEGVTVLRPEYIVPLKAKAWLDLTARKRSGEKIDGTDIKKHRNDVFRLYRILTPDSIPRVTRRVADDLKAFTDTVLADNEIPLKNFGYPNAEKSSMVVTAIRKLYGVDS